MSSTNGALSTRVATTQQWREVKAIVCDVDGTLTDGSIDIDDHGVETKRFCVRDGLGIMLGRESGGRIGVITGRRSLALTHRLRELGIESGVQGSKDKVEALTAMCAEWGVTLGDCAFVGDDLPDLAAMRACGLAVAVSGSAPEILAIAHHVTAAHPGNGALREVIECALKAQGRWDAVVARYAGATSTASASVVRAIS